MSEHVHLRLCGPKDSQAEFKIACALEDMINGHMLPIYAAEIVDESIRADLEECYELCKTIRKPTPQQLEDGMIRWPDPGPLMHLLWMGIALIAMRVPADHQGQGHAVELLHELSRLPRHRVPRIVADFPEIKFGYLWSYDTFMALKLWLVEVDRMESGQRYVNFSAFLARLYAAGVMDTLETSALVRPSPFTTRGRFISSSHNKSHTSAHEYEPWAAAAAQWIVHAGESIFNICAKEVVFETSKKRFSLILWESWKLKFEAVANVVEFSADGRRWATAAFRKMQTIEE